MDDGYVQALKAAVVPCVRGCHPHGAAGGGRVKRDKPFVARGIAAGNPNGWLVVVCKGSPKIQGNIRVTVREALPPCEHADAVADSADHCRECGWWRRFFGTDVAHPGLWSRWHKPRRG